MSARREHEADQRRLKDLVEAHSATREHVRAGNVLHQFNVDTPAVLEVLNLSIQDAAPSSNHLSGGWAISKCNLGQCVFWHQQ